MSELAPVSDDAVSVPLPPSGLDYADQLVAALGNATDAVLRYSGVRHDDINARHSGVLVVGWNKNQWTPLPTEAAPHVGQARAALTQLREFSACAARDAPDRLAELTKVENALERLVEQPSGSLPGGAPKATIEQVREHADACLSKYTETLRCLPTAFGRAERLLVADTSALLDRPDLQNWRLDDGPWTVVFLPQVHSELDDRKRDPRTRDAAQKVIRQIEDLDQRGDTFAGVPLTGKLTAREIPISADMGQTLPWLRADVPDDAIVAGALELRWQDLTCRIAIAASDRNVRNKARLAGLGAVRATEL